ncbi:MAG: hypothetical protein MST10_01900 [Lentisphaeria bacterium]|nr:hypothetical protein [Lentisphaeria bacterium]
MKSLFVFLLALFICNNFIAAENQYSFSNDYGNSKRENLLELPAATTLSQLQFNTNYKNYSSMLEFIRNTPAKVDNRIEIMILNDDKIKLQLNQVLPKTLPSRVSFFEALQIVSNNFNAYLFFTEDKIIIDFDRPRVLSSISADANKLLAVVNDNSGTHLLCLADELEQQFSGDHLQEVVKTKDVNNKFVKLNNSLAFNQRGLSRRLFRVNTPDWLELRKTTEIVWTLPIKKYPRAMRFTVDPGQGLSTEYKIPGYYTKIKFMPPLPFDKRPIDRNIMNNNNFKYVGVIELSYADYIRKNPKFTKSRQQYAPLTLLSANLNGIDFKSQEKFMTPSLTPGNRNMDQYFFGVDSVEYDDNKLNLFLTPPPTIAKQSTVIPYTDGSIRRIELWEKEYQATQNAFALQELKK